MGRPARKPPANGPKRSALARKSKGSPVKKAAQRKRAPLTAEKKAILAAYNVKKHGSFRAYCVKNDIPRSTANYQLNSAKGAARAQRIAKIVEAAKQMSSEKRKKHQQCRISAQDIIEKLGKDKVLCTPRQVNRILKNSFDKRPQRRRQTGQPNQESTPSQLRTIAAHQRYI